MESLHCLYETGGRAKIGFWGWSTFKTGFCFFHWVNVIPGGVKVNPDDIAGILQEVNPDDIAGILQAVFNGLMPPFRDAELPHHMALAEVRN
ncbi:hypothetical protein [Sporolactobacillus sp. KGMB 08714]|uniref:hypothetical protein n=1 Tax=Sporolactobacillus sp. KGMB 08714 TaxID=3064704 RepID=UPI002FBD4D58